MNRGGENIIISRWKEVVLAVVPDQRRREDLQTAVLMFAELARNHPAWERGLEKPIMGESQLANRWRAEAAAAATIAMARRMLLEALDVKFPGAVPADVRQLIQKQEAQGLLEDWHRAAIRAATYADFDAVLRR
jgi:hypothetical protein